MLRLEHLSDLYLQHQDAANAEVEEFCLGGRHFAFNSNPAIMGVINLSPDSWYRESVCLNQKQAIDRGIALHSQGADIIDLGAESTLAFASRAGQSEQSEKLLPVITGLRKTDVLVSAETYLPAVAQACLEAGANALNLTGGVHGREVYRLAAQHEAAIILCYVQGSTARDVGDFHLSDDPTSTMYEYFARSIETADQCGVKKILLDPGLGFYYRNLQDGPKRIRYQMEVFLNTFRLRCLGFPICNALPHAFEFFRDEVRAAEPFFAVLAALGKTDVLRTHEVPKIRAVLDTLQVF